MEPFDVEAQARSFAAAADKFLEKITEEATSQAIELLPLQPVRHVLWWFGDRDMGIQPGGRDEKLLELLSAGDDETIDALLVSEPFAHLVTAWLIGREEGGMNKLHEKVRSYERWASAAFDMQIAEDLP